MTTMTRRGLALSLLGSPLLAALPLSLLQGCSPSEDKPPAPAEIQAGASCDLDGMLLSDYPGPKGQIYYVGEPKVSWFCDTVELLSTLLAPEQQRSVRAAYVQDMAKADWDQPRGHWMDARQAWYVLGSRRQGSMGPTLASLGSEAAAQAFAAQHGGRVLPYAQIRPEMVDLSGGAHHDGRM